MKRFIKLIPAALALVTLASCSTEDFNFSGKSSPKNTLTVNVEQFDGLNTRAVREWKGADLNFQYGDQIRVYDNDLFKFDVYSFADGKFAMDGATSNIATTKFAAFPAEDVKRGYWDGGEVKLEMNIPNVIVYDEDSEDMIGDKIGYSSNLPMWGTAAEDAEYGVKADLYHLTGVLAINVKNMLQNVDKLILSSATQDIAGTFVATLDPENPSSVQLGKGGDDLVTYNFITIDLTQCPSQTSVIYVPVLAGVSDLQVWADKNGDGIVDEKVADYNSTYTFQRNKFKTLTAEFGIGSSTPGQLSELLESYANTLEETLTIDLEKFYVGTNGGVTDANYDGSTVIEVPASDANIVINFKDAASFVYGNNDANWPLELQDADPDAPFEGTITLNVNGKLSAPTDLTINLPKADVVLAGDFATSSAAKAFQFLAAKSLTIGDGTTTTAITSDGTSDFVFSNPMMETGVTKLTIAGKATLTTTNPIQFDKYTTEVNVAGKIIGDLGFADTYSLYTLNLTGTTGAAPVAAKITGDVTTIGNVNVALTAEGEAITGTLTMAGAEKTLALTQGYISAIKNAVIVYGSWQKPVNTIKLNNTNQGLAAFNALTDDGGTFTYTLADATIVTAVKSTTEWTESVWDGKKITVAGYQQFATYTTNDGTANNNAIFTASQLSSVAVTSASKLWNDIDLNSKEWTPNAISADLDGQKHTVKNLVLKTKSSSYGLFGNASGTVAIKDLTIDGAAGTYEAAAPAYQVNNIGALIGNNAAALTLNNITVSKVNFASTSTTVNNGTLSQVGGVVGTSTGTIAATKVKVAGTIDGYMQLGGIVGNTSANLTATGCDVSGIAFKQTNVSNKTMDMNYAMVGGIVGNVNNIAANVTITDCTGPASINFDKRAKMYLSDTSTETGNFYSYKENTTTPQLFVGYCGNPNSGYTVGTVSVTKGTATTTFTKANYGRPDEYTVGGTKYYSLYAWPVKE